AGAGGEALRRAETREPRCALNLPIVIGQTPPCPVANPGHPHHGDRTVRFPVVMAGSRVSLVSLAGTYSTALFAMMSTLVANGLRSRSSRWRPGSGAR